MIRFEQLLNKMYLMKDIFIPMDNEQFQLVQRTGLEMFLSINEICKNHNLRIMLGFGSALGTVRHKGFVPWDDDVDLLMPRKDYDKFISVCNQELPSNLIIYAPGSKNGPEVRYTKIFNKDFKIFPEGGNELSNLVCLDLMPLEYYDDKPLRRRIRWAVYLLISLAATTTRIWYDRSKDTDYKYLMKLTRKGKIEYFFRLVTGFFFSFFSYQKWLLIADDWYKNAKETNQFFIPSIFINTNPIDKDIMLPVSYGEFEGSIVPIPHRVEDYLVFQYGDWKKLPPEDKRRQHLFYRRKENQ